MSFFSPSLPDCNASLLASTASGPSAWPSARESRRAHRSVHVLRRQLREARVVCRRVLGAVRLAKPAKEGLVAHDGRVRLHPTPSAHVGARTSYGSSGEGTYLSAAWAAAWHSARSCVKLVRKVSQSHDLGPAASVLALTYAGAGIKPMRPHVREVREFVDVEVPIGVDAWVADQKAFHLFGNGATAIENGLRDHRHVMTAIGLAGNPQIIRLKLGEDAEKGLEEGVRVAGGVDIRNVGIFLGSVDWLKPTPLGISTQARWRCDSRVIIMDRVYAAGAMASRAGRAVLRPKSEGHTARAGASVCPEDDRVRRGRMADSTNQKKSSPWPSLIGRRPEYCLNFGGFASPGRDLISSRTASGGGDGKREKHGSRAPRRTTGDARFASAAPPVLHDDCIRTPRYLAFQRSTCRRTRRRESRNQSTAVLTLERARQLSTWGYRGGGVATATTI